MSQKKHYLYTTKRRKQAHYFSLLAHCERLNIISLLSQNPEGMSYSELESQSPLHSSTVSEHLYRLVSYGFVELSLGDSQSVYILNFNKWEKASQELLDFFQETQPFNQKSFRPAKSLTA